MADILMTTLMEIPTAALVAELARRFPREAPAVAEPLDLVRLGEMVGVVHGIDAVELRGPERTRRIAHARMQFCVAARQALPALTVAEIAVVIRRDHSTVCHASIRHGGLLASDPEYRRQWERLEAAL